VAIPTSYTPQYTDTDTVELWLAGKVKIGTNPVTDITPEFLARLICNSEGQVLRELSHFYTIPLQTISGGDYEDLPQVTYEFLDILFTLRAVWRVLSVDFAKTNSVTAKNYRDQAMADYKEALATLYRKDNSGRTVAYLLPDLKINPYKYTGRDQVIPMPIIAGSMETNLTYAINQMTKTYNNWWSFWPYGERGSVNTGN
jgi:hypothetical protein